VGELAEGPHEATAERFVLDARDGTAVDAIHARPHVQPEAGLVLHPDMMGVRPLFDDLCRRVATNGFAVVCAEPFAHFPSEVRTGDATVRMAHMKDMDDDVQLGDLAAGAEFLRQTDGIELVSIIGFCMGGMYTLKAAATGLFGRAVAFYGMIRVPEDWKGPSLRDALDTAPQVCPTLAIFGGKDPWVPLDDVEALRASWRDRDDCEIVVYPDADHGFVHGIERPAHRPDDAANAWNRAITFLRD
jgi:carboxymethylenebutenolidase